jgi:SAM-dependent methyltransferase
MTMPGRDTSFAGSVPQTYERFLVPLIFEFYAADLAERVRLRQPGRVLEIAAGTGVVTRQLATVLPPSVSVIATDLNQPMLDQAIAAGTARPVEWKQADANALPFPDRAFDVVVCQFGAMFFPNKPGAFAEARRVLREGGCFIFNVWDRLEDNEFPDAVTESLAVLFPDDPPRFLARIPYGYHDREAITRDLAAGGFVERPQITTLAARSRAASPSHPAIAFCQGTPLRGEIETISPSRVPEATDAASRAIERRFGGGAVEGKIQAHVIIVTRARD